MAENTIKQIEIPGYRLIKLLGSGAMASVYLAEHSMLKREVALKILSPGLAYDDVFRDRFLSEGQSVAKLNHPSILDIYDIGVADDFYYLATNYLPNGNLTQRIKNGITTPKLVAITRQIASALDYAHQSNIIHRDIKPDNILFDENNCAILADFGLARVMYSTRSKTVPGLTLGTPSYMAPEQSTAASSSELDGRCDLYSLGVVFYEMLTGSLPYHSPQALGLAVKHANDPVPLLPDNLNQWQVVVNTLLAKDPDHRPQTGEEFITLISKTSRGNITKRNAAFKDAKYRGGHTRLSRSNQIIVSLSLLIIGFASAQFWFYSNDEAPSTPQTSNYQLAETSSEDTLPLQKESTPHAPVDEPSDPQEITNTDNSNDPTTLTDTASVAIETLPKDDPIQLARNKISLPSPLTIDLFAATLRINPNSADAIDGLLDIGEKLQRGLRLDPGNPKAIQGIRKLGDVFAQQALWFIERGELNKARHRIQTGLKVVRNHLVLEQLLIDLDS